MNAYWMINTDWLMNFECWMHGSSWGIFILLQHHGGLAESKEKNGVCSVNKIKMPYCKSDKH